MTHDEYTVIYAIQMFALKRAPHADHPFTLASGRTSDYLIDLKAVMLNPYQLRLLCRVLYHRLLQEWPGVRYVAGVTLGGVPLAIGVSLLSIYATEVIPTLHGDAGAWADVPILPVHQVAPVLVRTETKTHGTGKLVEAPPLLSSGQDIVLLEDVVTTGESSMRSVAALEADGRFDVVGVLAVVDREERGEGAVAREVLSLDRPELRLVSIFTGDQIKGNG